MEVIGWIGSICFSLCVIPQVVTTWRTGDTDGLSGYFLGLWYIGVCCSMAYLLHNNISSGMFNWPLIVNFFLNWVCLNFLVYFKLVPIIRYAWTGKVIYKF